MVVVFICLLIQQINFSPKDLQIKQSATQLMTRELHLFMILLENLKLKNDSSCTIEDLFIFPSSYKNLYKLALLPVIITSLWT